MTDIVVTTSDFRSRIDFRLAEAIRSLGFILGDTSGYKIDPDALEDSQDIGAGYSILRAHPDQSTKRRVWGILPPKQLKLQVIGVMWVNAPSKKATPERWVFETFGRDLSLIAQATADLLYQDLQVPIHIHLASDKVKEVFLVFRGPSY